MSRRIEIRLAGTGGQGMILAGILLAEAAAADGKQVLQTQSYGPEARGGASRADVIISDQEVHFPEVLEADVLLCMSQEACDRYADEVKERGLIILDADNVARAPTTEAVRAPITTLSRETTGREISANVVALGLLVGLTGLVSRNALETAVRARVPKGTEEINLRALAAGFEMADRLRGR